MVGGWSYDVEGSVAVWNFRTWYDRDTEEVEEMLETFREVTADPAVTASVVLLGKGGAIDGDTFDLMESYLDLFQKNSVKKVALVSPDIKGRALMSVLDDAQDVEVDVTDDSEEAMAWARGESTD